MTKKIERLSAAGIAEGLGKQSFLKADDGGIIAERLTDSIEKILCAACDHDLADCVDVIGNQCAACHHWRGGQLAPIPFRGEQCSPHTVRSYPLTRQPSRRVAYAFA